MNTYELKSDNKHLNDLLNQALKENENLQETIANLKEEIAKFEWEQPYYKLYCNIVAQRDKLQEENARLKEKLKGAKIQ